MIFTNIDPQTSTSQLLVFAVGERESQPILVRLEWSEEAFWQITDCEDLAERGVPFSLWRRAQTVLAQNIFDLFVIYVFVS